MRAHHVKRRGSYDLLIKKRKSIYLSNTDDVIEKLPVPTFTHHMTIKNLKLVELYAFQSEGQNPSTFQEVFTKKV